MKLTAPKRVLIVVLVSLLAACAAAAPVITDTRIPMTTPAGERLTLEAKVYDITDGNRHPALILNHGSPRKSAQRRDPKYANFDGPARWFQSLGYVVVKAKRRGFGTSDGAFAEGFGKCETADHRRGGLSSANDIQAVVDYARILPSVDPGRIILLGQSAGGWGVLALASRQPAGVIGVVNFAGGRGSLRDGFNCNPDGLVKTAGEFGKTVKVPSIWLYSVNDQYLPPTLTRAMFESFRAATASKTEYVLLPAYGRDGHATFGAEKAAGNWHPAVERFLASLR
jgi:dienelactone hydrolase